MLNTGDRMCVCGVRTCNILAKKQCVKFISSFTQHPVNTFLNLTSYIITETFGNFITVCCYVVFVLF